MLILSAFFSSSEIAFVSASRVRAEARAHGEGLVASAVRSFLSDPQHYLITTLVGNNLALVLYSSLMAIALEPGVYGFWARTLSVGPVVEVATIVTQTLVATVLVLFVGEIIPKSIARRTADRAVFALAIPLKISYFVLLPFIKVSGWITVALLRLFGYEAESMDGALRKEIEATILQSSARGEIGLDKKNSQLLSNVFRISRLRVKDSMVPRTDIEGVDHDASMVTLRERFSATGYSKLPIYRDNIDNVVGVVFAYDLFNNPGSLSEMIREVRFVPETKKSRDLLSEFLDDLVSIAIVIDEYGGTAGLVTIEDLIEELTGEIQDEFDPDEFVARRINERTLIANGRAEISELRSDFGLDLPEGDYETVAGMLLERLGYIPAPKEECLVDIYRIVIVRSTKNRIELVRITKQG